MRLIEVIVLKDNNNVPGVEAMFMLEALTEHTNNYAYIYDFIQNTYTLSDGMANDFGIKQQGADFREFWPPCAIESDRTRICQNLQQALAVRQTRLQLEYQIIDKCGHYKWISEHMTLRYHAQTGGPQLLVAVLQDAAHHADTTDSATLMHTIEQQPMGEGVEQFNARLKAILDATPLCLNLWNSSFENTMCNQEAIKLFELANEQEYTAHFFQLSPPFQPDGSASGDKALTKIKYAFENGRTQFFWMHCNLKGEEIPAEITLVRIDDLDDGGKPLVAGFTRDIRAQLAVQRAQEQASQRIRAVLDSMPLACILWSMEKEILDCNQGAVNLFGAQDKQEVLRDFDAFNPPLQPDGSDSMQKKHAKFKEAIDTGFSFFEWVYCTKQGKGIPSEVTLVKVKLSEEELIVAYSRDLRELYQTLDLNDRLAKLAYHDLLTGCASRTRFVEQLEESFLLDRECVSSLVIFDVDYFKSINDNYGHAVGDMVLKKVVKCAERLIPKSCMLGRFGGDEFMIQCQHLTQTQLQDTLEKLVYAVSELRFQHEGKEFSVSISAGASFKNEKDKTYQKLLERADKALYDAKANGRNCSMIL